MPKMQIDEAMNKEINDSFRQSENKSTFDVLNAVDVNGHTEKKQGLTYLTWSWAWAELKKRFPKAKYEIERFDNKPYLFDPATGYMVFTKVTIEGETIEMWLPVMDGANMAMLDHEYEYTTYKGKKRVKAASMTDINKTIMRCLVKNIGMFGLGLYIYSGEDLPEQAEELANTEKTVPQSQNQAKTGQQPNYDVTTEEITQLLVDNSRLKATLDSYGIQYRESDGEKGFKNNAYICNKLGIPSQDVSMLDANQISSLNRFYQSMIQNYRNSQQGAR